MRTTINLAPDVQAIVERVRRERGLSMSDAVNSIVRERAMGPHGAPSAPPTLRPLGLRVDVANVADALDLLDDLDAS